MVNILASRLYNQRLEGAKFQRPEEVVAWFGAVQAQEYALTHWTLGMRMETATDDHIEQACDDGAILRTHLMRPTWHFITPEDIRWILELTAPRVHQVNGTTYRKLELDEALLKRGCDIIARAVEGDRHLTRAEIAAVLAENGIDEPKGLRLGYILHYAELEGVVCSGRRRGKQHTYALVAERAPHARRLARDEALAELALRFYTSHGPATVKDFAWWSGLTVTDVKSALHMLSDQLTHEQIDGQDYWFSASASAIEAPPATGHLLPIYDEYTVTYKGRSAPLDLTYRERHAGVVEKGFFTSTFIFGGEIIGLWRRTFSKKTVVIESVPLRPYSPAENDAFDQAAQRFGAFLGLPVVLTEGQPSLR